MAFNRALPLDERIKTIIADAEAFVDAKAAELAKDTPGVPIGVIRNLITARANGCPCRQVLEITKQNEAA